MYEAIIINKFNMQGNSIYRILFNFNFASLNLLQNTKLISKNGEWKITGIVSHVKISDNDNEFNLNKGDNIYDVKLISSISNSTLILEIGDVLSVHV